MVPPGLTPGVSHSILRSMKKKRRNHQWTGPAREFMVPNFCWSGAPSLLTLVLGLFPSRQKEPARQLLPRVVQGVPALSYRAKLAGLYRTVVEDNGAISPSHPHPRA